MPELALSPLAVYRARVSAEKRRAVIAVCDLTGAPEALQSVSAVARAANVSREFIHSHPDLHSRVVAAIARARGRRISVDRAGGRAVTLGEAERTTLINALTRAKTANRELEMEVQALRTQRQRELGAKLEALTEPTATERLADAALSERIQAKNSSLRRELADARALVAQLQDDLKACRLALAQALGAANEPNRLSGRSLT